MIPAADQREIRDLFAKQLLGRVRLDLFTQTASPLHLPDQPECPLCKEAEELANELDSLSKRIALTVHDIKNTRRQAEEFGIDRVPAFVLRGKANRPLRFLGLPTGESFPVFVEAIVRSSTGGAGLSEDATRQLKKVRSPVDVRIVMMPSCSHSPTLVRTALLAGLLNSKVSVTIVEASEFPDLVQRYVLQAVPLTVVNESVAVLGAMDETTFVNVLRATVEGRDLDEKMKTGPMTLLRRRRLPSSTPTTPGGIVIPEPPSQR